MQHLDVKVARPLKARDVADARPGDSVPGFRDQRTFSAMWRAASAGERALVVGAPVALVFAVMVAQ